eukprot:XP_011673913.1 PREDICTED: octopamine receptor beta-2R-like [Strongylocentrotus purpuratus]
MLGAILFNILVITTILRVRSLRQNYHNMLVLNLSFADLGVALTSMTFSLVSVFDSGHFLTTHDGVCKANGFFSTMFSYTNFPVILSIATDRFLIVVLSKRFPPNRRRVFVMIVVCWLVGIIIASIASAGLVIDYEYDQSTKHCTRIWGIDMFRIISSVLYLGVTIPGLIAIYVIIAYFIRKEGLSLQRHQLSSSMSTLRSLSNVPNRSVMDSGEESETRITLPQPAPMRRLSDSAEDDGNISVSTEAHSVRNVNATATDRKIKMKRRRQRHVAHKRVILVGALLVFTTIICWTPYLMYHSNYIRVSEGEGHWFGVLTMWLGYCNALFDPLIYAFLNRRVRAELWKLKRKTFACCNS